MKIRDLYIGLGATNGIFTNFGDLILQNASTYLFNQIVEHSGGDVRNTDPFYFTPVDVRDYFDPYDLYPNMIGFSTGNTIIRASNLSGFQTFGVLTTDGSMTMTDTYISHIAIPFGADDDTQVILCSHSLSSLYCVCWLFCFVLIFSAFHLVVFFVCVFSCNTDMGIR